MMRALNGMTYEIATKTSAKSWKERWMCCPKSHSISSLLNQMACQWMAQSHPESQVHIQVSASQLIDAAVFSTAHSEKRSHCCWVTDLMLEQQHGCLDWGAPLLAKYWSCSALFLLTDVSIFLAVSLLHHALHDAKPDRQCVSSSPGQRVRKLKSACGLVAGQGFGRGSKKGPGRHSALGGRGGHSQRVAPYQPPSSISHQPPTAHKFQVCADLLFFHAELAWRWSAWTSDAEQMCQSQCFEIIVNSLDCAVQNQLLMAMRLLCTILLLATCILHVLSSVSADMFTSYRWWAAMMMTMEQVDLMRTYQMMVTMAYSMALNHWMKQMLPVVVDDWCLPIRLLHCVFDMIFCTAHYDITPESTSTKFAPLILFPV